MPTTISQVTDFLESIAPINFQEPYDNSGLLIGDHKDNVSGVLCCLDVTEEIILEAEEYNCNLIVAHHPLIFTSLKKLTGSSVVERSVALAIRKNIAVYAIHTNLDNILYKGVNGKIADIIGLQDIQVLVPKSENNKAFGSGLVGNLSLPKRPIEFLTLVKTKMNTQIIRHTALIDKPINRVAVCGGSGKFLLNHAIRAKADIFVSADFKYHDFFEANDQIVIADIGHYESEQFTIDLLRELILSEFSTFAPRCTNLITNPINYF